MPHHVSVKEAVLPFARFPLTDPTLGPEMRSTGEVMGVGGSFGEAFAKAQRGAGAALPTGGIAVISTADMDKPRPWVWRSALARRLHTGRDRWHGCGDSRCRAAGDTGGEARRRRDRHPDR